MLYVYCILRISLQVFRLEVCWGLVLKINKKNKIVFVIINVKIQEMKYVYPLFNNITVGWDRTLWFGRSCFLCYSVNFMCAIFRRLLFFRRKINVIRCALRCWGLGTYTKDSFLESLSQTTGICCVLWEKKI